MTIHLRRCSRCLIPETHETIVFDEEGVCNICRAHEKKREKIDWAARRAQFEALIERVRGKYAYDCIVPFSGGKDSTFTLYYLVREYHLKPLVVQFDHGFLRPKLVEQNIRTLKTLGADFLSFRPNWKVVQKLMLESLKRKGDFCWHCHTGIFSFPMQIAVKFQVPLLIWGEPSAEYTAYFDYDDMEEVDEKRFNRFVNLGITADDMVGMIEGVEPRELEPFRYPPLRELRRLGVRSVCLGSYIPWDPKKQAEIIRRELGWEGNVVEGVPAEYYYEKVECFMQGVRDYLRYLKRGYGRTAHLASLDIRNGRLDRETGERLMAEYDGKRPASLDLFLEAVEMDEETFHRLALTHTVAPWKPDLDAIRPGEPLPDHGKFIRPAPVRD
ncbi:MAG: LPS biosynthesis protein [Dehalococcoidia bacterium]|nr:MAG: LPS biosynthesis protein [Dehalococcoidia bacterium]